MIARHFRLLTGLLIASVLLAVSGVAVADAPPFPGTQSEWHGFDRYDFEVDGRPVLVVAPRQPAPGKPWVWHGEFFGHKPAPDIALLERGFHIVYMRVPDMFGSPKAIAHWNAFYDELTGTYDFAKKAALVGLSRGGLYCYNWAAANPDKVACIYGDAPVCDFKSWPGGKGKGKGSSRDWKLVVEVFGFETEAEALAWPHNPIDSLAPLAKAAVPLLHVYGEADEVVPWDENTGIIAERYRMLGGSITLINKPGVGHHPHGLEDSTPIVEFITRHAAAAPRGHWVETGTLPAPEAFQAAAADERFVYAIANRQVAKYDRSTRQRVAVSTGEAKHLNSGFFHEGTLYCAHSNYPQTPEQSQVKVLDVDTMELSTAHDFGDYGGSLTWVLRRDGHWWCNFARYGEQNGETFFAKFDDDWNELARWTYPAEVIAQLGRYSLSGGIHDGNELLVTGHDDPILFRLRLPEEGSVL
ncbi:MAG: alpha/beta hydrolase family protein [Maioricimonas sp. JB049]